MDVPQQELEETEDLEFIEDSASRFSVILDSVPLPSTCSGCNLPATSNRRMIDLGTQIDFYGAVMICLECATAVARIVNYFPAKDLDNLRRSVDYYREKVEEAKEKVEALENVVFSYSLSDIVGGRNSSTSDSGDESSVESAERSDQASSESTDESDSPNGKGGRKGGRSSKQVTI